MRSISLAILFCITASLATFPMHHWIHYPEYGAAAYLRVDEFVPITENYVEGVGEILLMNQTEAFEFLRKNWLQTKDPNRPKTDMNWFSTYAKNYKGGLPTYSPYFSTDPTIEIIMDGDKEITAHFERDPNYVPQDPNLPRIDGLYFTLGDGFAAHTYLDCRHLIGKEERIALIYDPNDGAERKRCLTCTARRLRDMGDNDE